MKVDYWSSTKKIQLKENSTENSAKKNLKKRRKFKELWNFSIKQQKKRKILKLKELCFPDSLSDKFPANCTKSFQYFIFSIPFFLISLYKIPFLKTLLSVLSFRINIRTKKLRNLLFKWALMAH